MCHYHDIGTRTRDTNSVGFTFFQTKCSVSCDRGSFEVNSINQLAEQALISLRNRRVFFFVFGCQNEFKSHKLFCSFPLLTKKISFFVVPPVNCDRSGQDIKRNEFSKCLFKRNRFLHTLWLEC